VPASRRQGFHSGWTTNPPVGRRRYKIFAFSGLIFFRPGIRSGFYWRSAVCVRRERWL